ncbi:MAG: hypothetical protein DDT27_01182 [Dehalococcoidia bacterium]|nr:hypothetical protein [Chloroflexota bacterium]
MVGKFGEYYLVAPLTHLLNVVLRSEDNLSPPGGVGILNAFTSQDESAGGKIWPRNEFHKVTDGDVGIVDKVGDAVAYLSQIVWRDVGGHTNGNARCTV